MVRLIPLGGLGEIGLNCMVLETGEDMILIDAGVLFPTSEQPGVDVLVPDFDYVLKNADRLRGVLLTHGHEDHVGALPHLLRKLQVPVYGTPFTLSFLKNRLDEAGISADLRDLAGRDTVRFGTTLSAEALRVTHSVPEALGYAITTPEGRFLHTGDFKLDPSPIDGKTTDLARIEELGDDGVQCLLSDSTNVEVHTETGSEQGVADTFARILPGRRGRIVVGLFASHQHRVQHLMELAEKLGRKVVPLGRSMIRNVETARELGVLKVPPGVLISPETAAGLPAHEVMILTTGSQAEPRAGLSQLAAGEGPLRLDPGDTVVLSSTPIPGNERQVGALIDALMWRGAEVVHHRTEPGVHCSGHASRPQQQRMIELVRPRHFLPVHGELRHLMLHRALAGSSGVSAQGLLLARDGDTVSFRGGIGGVSGSVPAGRLMLERASGVAVPPEVLAERMKLMDGGQVVAVLVLDRDTNQILSGPHLTPQGLPPAESSVIPAVAHEVREGFEALSVAIRGDDAWVKEELARSVRKALRQRTGRRPWVTPVVVRVSSASARAVVGS